MLYVLVVDDDADSRDVLCRYLSRSGYVAESVSNGREALISVLAQVPDAIVLDLAMPDMDGTSFLDVLRSYLRLKTVPVVVWTAYAQNLTIKQAKKRGVNQILPKASSSFPDIGRAIQRELEAPSV